MNVTMHASVCADYVRQSLFFIISPLFDILDWLHDIIILSDVTITHMCLQRVSVESDFVLAKHKNAKLAH